MRELQEAAGLTDPRDDGPDRTATQRGAQGRARRLRRRLLRTGGWLGAALVVVMTVVVASTWLWWRAAPSEGQRSRGVNALWAAHEWVGEAHDEREYRGLAETLRRGEISDVFFHVGPLTPTGACRRADTRTPASCWPRWTGWHPACAPKPTSVR